MIDRAKRNTLKILSVAAGSAAVCGTALAGALRSDVGENDGEMAELASIDVNTRVSALHNDLEIVFTNSGTRPATITHMTPGITTVARGEFDFSKLLKGGPVKLAAGESVSVPLQRKAVKMWASPNGHALAMKGSLADVLRDSVSIVTEGNSFASVTIGETAIA